MNQKLRYLFGNMGWMTISNFASKVLVFLMVPFYTRVLSTQEYGLYDLGYSMALLLAPLITLNTGEAIMRYIIVDKDNTHSFFSTALYISLLGSALSLIVLAISKLMPSISNDLRIIISGCCLVIPSNAIYIVLSQFARGIDRVRDMAIGGFINSFLLVTLSAIFVLVLHLSVMGCFYGAALSMIVAALYIAYRCESWRYLSRPTAEHAKQLVSYGFPLSINSLGWWANSSLSRYVTALILGVPSSGLLAAAYKVPAIPKAIQQIFIQAWQISSIRDFDRNDTDGFFSKTYAVVGMLSAMLTSCVVVFMPLLATILFAGDFLEAWHYVPLLMVCIVFDCLASILGGVFSAVGNTKPIATSAALSVITTLVASVLGIKLWGIQGACAASALSSVVIWATRLVESRQYIALRVDWRQFISTMLLLSFQISMSLQIGIGWFWYVMQIGCVCAMILLSAKVIDYQSLVFRLLKSAKQKRH